METELKEVKKIRIKYLSPKYTGDLSYKYNHDEEISEKPKSEEAPDKRIDEIQEKHNQLTSHTDEVKPAENKTEKVKTQKFMFYCEKCTYKSKKEVTLKKHVTLNTKNKSVKCVI